MLLLGALVLETVQTPPLVPTCCCCGDGDENIGGGGIGPISDTGIGGSGRFSLLLLEFWPFLLLCVELVEAIVVVVVVVSE